MAMQLTPDQEQRIQAIVSTGAYASAEEAINAAVLVVETAATVDLMERRRNSKAYWRQGWSHRRP